MDAIRSSLVRYLLVVGWVAAIAYIASPPEVPPRDPYIDCLTARIEREVAETKRLRQQIALLESELAEMDRRVEKAIEQVEMAQTAADRLKRHVNPIRLRDDP